METMKHTLDGLLAVNAQLVEALETARRVMDQPDEVMLHVIVDMEAYRDGREVTLGHVIDAALAAARGD